MNEEQIKELRRELLSGYEIQLDNTLDRINKTNGIEDRVKEELEMLFNTATLVNYSRDYRIADGFIGSTSRTTVTLEFSTHKPIGWK